MEFQGAYAKIQVSPEVVLIENNGLKAQTIRKALDSVEFYKNDIIAECTKFSINKEQDMKSKEITKVWFSEGRIWIATNQGEQYSQPLEAFPALYYADAAERKQFYLWHDNTSIRWEKIDEDIHISNFFEKESVNYDNEVNQLLTRFPWLDMKAFAEYIGMHWTKLARIRFGIWTPTPETLQKIKTGIRTIGKEMSAAVL